MNKSRLWVLLAVAFTVLACSPKKSESPVTQSQTQTENETAVTQTEGVTTAVQTQTAAFNIYGAWEYAKADEKGNFYVPPDEGPGNPYLVIDDDNSMVYGAYETNIKGHINKTDANNYQFVVNYRSRMFTQEAVDEIIYLQYNPDTNLLKYNDRRWEEEYFFVKMGTQPHNPTVTQTPSTDFQMNGTTLVKYIGNDAHVIIPSSVSMIGDWAFGDCKNLTSVDIPSSVTVIGAEAFSGCNLTSVTLSRKTIVEYGNFDEGWQLHLKAVEIHYRD